MDVRTWSFPGLHPPGDGPWQDEPDRVEWFDEATGLPCVIVRNHVGVLCGYVGVPRRHLLYGELHGRHHLALDVRVHGGLTFSGPIPSPGDVNSIEDATLSHVPGPGQLDDVWWFGFSCDQRGDLMPYFPLGAWGRCEYRTIAYVTVQTVGLAAQLAQVPIARPDRRGR
jgi:hypothetical protein